MSVKIQSDIEVIEKPSEITTEIIETQLLKRYKSLIRWAIVDISDNNLKICVTYEKVV